MPALSSSWTSSFPFSPWCLLVQCIYRQQFTSPLHFCYAGINMKAVLMLWWNQTAPSLCSPWHHFHGSLYCLQSHHHTPEETSLLQKNYHFPGFLGTLILDHICLIAQNPEENPWGCRKLICSPTFHKSWVAGRNICLGPFSFLNLRTKCTI